ncbi:bifunctional phosphopantothenoylcysteine decarboxylase/phosphopantothenate--cysteine ligase CoaBC [Peptoniphilus sp. MSJ-1]|uniref:Coenzyme A biosynthesis bifunctional protein CoaBC n=1 Tax=Peptoniphilus ovalis TaxID=2841503 RepID=A0ABS6FG18_9FIRM|nr:bifunctional phosphopantothenoylcysteine decarboxylase/phosphopantothenate--cysteine ligase CoaBC [Peptoniphilus ovalis]MBU5669125.1 bifunctional phosphopantothenoylcysteine decarboxylase/phosphopantothenate--cysteine ligase CoaBC [Peptoniphilus ovalis]
MLKGKKILLGVTGGIACYKSPGICSLLRKKGAEVKVVMTKSTTEFVTPLTFQTMSNNVVHVEMFNQLFNMDVEHISLAKWADIIVIAPATANIIGKFANGISDDMLSTVLMASRSKVMIAPGMNTVMLNSVANQKNIQTLKERGVIILDTQTDLLACNDYGSGKMLEPSQIVDEIDRALTPKDLEGKKFVITAGPTVEALDPVRFITNRSSGKMGYALAERAEKRGAKVTLISGPTSIDIPKVENFVRIKSTRDMFDEVGKYFDECDVLIKAAAPADYRPKNYSDEKIKKGHDSDMSSIEMEQNPDIAKHYGNQKKHQILVGFAAESTNVEEFAKEKLAKKNMDMIVANNIKRTDGGFGTDTNVASIITSASIDNLEIMSKVELADEILDRVKKLLS